MMHLFGEWEIDESADRLRRGDTVVKIERRAMAVLLHLLKRQDEVVTKDDLIDAVWKGAAVSDHSVAIVISDLRRALGDNRQSPRYIETIPKRGYRLLTPAAPPTAPAQASIRGTAASPKQLRGAWRPWLGGAAAALICIAGAVLLYLHASAPVTQPAPPVPPKPQGVIVADITNATGQADLSELAFALSELVTARLSTQADRAVLRWRLPLGNADDFRQARSQFAANTVSRAMTGRLILDGKQPVLVVQMTDLNSRAVAWAETYRVNTDGLLSQSREIARDAASAVGQTLPEIPETVHVPPQTYALYWRAQYLWSLRDTEASRRAVSILRQISGQYPGFEPAAALLAQIYAHKTGEHLGLPRTDTFALSRQYLDRARTLAPNAADIAITEAILSFYRDNDVDRAQHFIEQAIRISPSNALAWQTAAMIQSSEGNDGEALQDVNRAYVIDPTLDSVAWDKVWFLYVAGRFQDAFDAARSAQRTSAPVWFYFALIHQALDQSADAEQSWLARAQQRGLDEAAARRLAAQISSQLPRTFYTALLDACSHSPCEEEGVPLAILDLNAGKKVEAQAIIRHKGSPRDSWLWLWASRIPALAKLKPR